MNKQLFVLTLWPYIATVITNSSIGGRIICSETLYKGVFFSEGTCTMYDLQMCPHQRGVLFSEGDLYNVRMTCRCVLIREVSSFQIQRETCTIYDLQMCPHQRGVLFSEGGMYMYNEQTALSIKLTLWPYIATVTTNSSSGGRIVCISFEMETWTMYDLQMCPHQRGVLFSVGGMYNELFLSN